MTKATALSHPMQALVKYHGLRDWDLRIPYHDSVSVNIDALWVKTTVEFGDYEKDVVKINGNIAYGKALDRCLKIIDFVRDLAHIQDRARVESFDSLHLDIRGSLDREKGRRAKGLGFSAAGGAALAMASFAAAKLDSQFGWDMKLISRIARRLAGSACRSVVGGYARWYAGKDDETSYAEKIGSRKDLDMTMVIVPVSSGISTDQAHSEVETSPFLQARIDSANARVVEMVNAIKEGDLKMVGALAEQDTMELHAVTMTGEGHLLVYRNESLKVIQIVKKLRMAGKEVYFSMQTGPSVFINTYPEDSEIVRTVLEGEGLDCIVSSVGDEVRASP